MTIAEILERSGATDYNRDVLEARLTQYKYSKVNSLECHLDKEQLASALARAKGSYMAKAYKQFEKYTFEQKQAALKYPGKCFGDLARKALLHTTDLINEVLCIKHNCDYKERIHVCNKCQDHFYGTYVELDHFDVGFREILVAFLDSHVEGWCILPDAQTVAKTKHTYGYRSNLQRAHRIDVVETEVAYWQRVKNESKMRWAFEELGDKFVAFHNRVVKLQMLCLTCHDEKTNAESDWNKVIRSVCPVYDEELGKSKRRKLNEAADEAVMKEEAVLMDKESVTKLVTSLREAIGSMQPDAVSDALSKVPPKLQSVLPMVKTATALLHDINVYESGGANIVLDPLPTADTYSYREARITWDM